MNFAMNDCLNNNAELKNKQNRQTNRISNIPLSDLLSSSVVMSWSSLAGVSSSSCDVEVTSSLLLPVVIVSDEAVLVAVVMRVVWDKGTVVEETFADASFVGMEALVASDTVWLARVGVSVILSGRVVVDSWDSSLLKTI